MLSQEQILRSKSVTTVQRRQPRQLYSAACCLYPDITNLDSNGLPKYLSMDDQSRFAIGYYHQREDLYKTTTDKEKN